MLRLHPRSTLFPYTTLFRSSNSCWERRRMAEAIQRREWWKIALVTVPAIVLAGSASGWLSNSGYGNDWFDGLTKDRKSTRLNSSHSQISYAVFCLKKKKKKK